MRRVKLIILRKQHKLSQIAVAQHLGISVAAYGRIETGKNLLTAEIMLKLCYCYGCSLESLLDNSPGNGTQAQASPDKNDSNAAFKEISMEQLYRHVIKMQETNERCIAFLVQNMLEHCKGLLQDMNKSIPVK